MGARTFDIERAARAVVHAELNGDEAAATEFGVTVRTLQRWRKRVAEDPEMSGRVAYKVSEVKHPEGWADRATATVRRMLDFFDKAADQADPADPETLDAMAGIFTGIAEAVISLRILDETASEGRADAGAGAEAPAFVVPAKWGGDGARASA